MTDNHQLVAYLATLGALIIVFIAALVTAALAPDIIGKIEAFGLGTITGGLIGALRFPTSKAPTVGPNDTVNVTQEAPLAKPTP